MFCQIHIFKQTLTVIVLHGAPSNLRISDIQKKSIKLVPKNTGNYQSSCTYILYMTMHTVVTKMRLMVKGMISSYTGCPIHCSVLNKELVADLGDRVVKIIDF